MPLILYHARNSVCSQLVRVTLAELGLAYESRLIDLTRGEQFAPDYVRLNPASVVPTLLDGPLVLVESACIAQHLDAAHGGGRLMPDAEAARAEARLWLLHGIELHAAINALTFSTANRGGVPGGGDAAAVIAQMPDPVARMRRRSLDAEGLASPFVGQALFVLRRAFGRMDRALGAALWLAGPRFSLADITVLPYLDRLDCLGFSGLWADRPGIRRWLAAMRERPSFDEAVLAIAPEGSRERMRAKGSPHWPELEGLWRERALA